MCMAVSKKELQCTIGKNIRDARKACGYTKEFLAEKAEISVEHITPVSYTHLRAHNYSIFSNMSMTIF